MSDSLNRLLFSQMYTSTICKSQWAYQIIIFSHSTNQTLFLRLSWHAHERQNFTVSLFNRPSLKMPPWSRPNFITNTLKPEQKQHLIFWTAKQTHILTRCRPSRRQTYPPGRPAKQSIRQRSSRWKTFKCYGSLQALSTMLRKHTNMRQDKNSGLKV